MLTNYSESWQVHNENPQTHLDCNDCSARCEPYTERHQNTLGQSRFTHGEKMKYHLFLISLTAGSDHCRRCGGEEYEGDTGHLKQYLVVEEVKHTGPVPKYHTYEEEALCLSCMKGLSTQV